MADPRILGLTIPFRRLADDFAHGEGIQVVTSNVTQTLGVKAASEDGKYGGSYPWRGDFGCQLHRLRHNNYGDLFNDLARVFMADAVNRWEPRAALDLGATTMEARSGGHLVRVPVTSGQRLELSGLAEVTL
jgi:hypothetical protein